MTLDEEWEALAVMFKLQGITTMQFDDMADGDVSDDNPMYALYVSEGIGSASYHDAELSREEIERRVIAQMRRDKALWEILFPDHPYEATHTISIA